MLAEAGRLGNVTSNVCILRDQEGDFVWQKDLFYIICMVSFKEEEGRKTAVLYPHHRGIL